MKVETIAAIITASGIGAVGIVRLSGPEALPIARRLVPRLPQSPPSHRLLFRRIEDPDGCDSLDEGLVAFMKAPHSYTGEDVVELQCHGGPVNLRRVLDCVLRAGARLAEPGEFTRRAFLNGRLDLIQAEAVADLINARSEASCRLARRHLEGRLSRRIGHLRESLATSLVLVEAGIDFSLEEHIYSVDSEQLSTSIAQISGEVDRLLATYDQGRAQREGIRCVICGRPNAGKSSLLNCLLDEDRAIISDQPGTTRDYLDGSVEVGGHLFTLIDTAGLRASEDPVEVEGVRRTMSMVELSDIVFYVVDRSIPWAPEDTSFLDSTVNPTIVLLNKSDLANRCSVPDLPTDVLDVVETRLDRGGHTEALRSLLEATAVRAGLIDSFDTVLISRTRHREALASARRHLESARRDNLAGEGEEVIALDLRLALDAVGEVVGTISPDEILGRIFSEFCIGK